MFGSASWHGRDAARPNEAWPKLQTNKQTNRTGWAHGAHSDAGCVRSDVVQGGAQLLRVQRTTLAVKRAVCVYVCVGGGGGRSPHRHTDIPTYRHRHRHRRTHTHTHTRHAHTIGRWDRWCHEHAHAQTQTQTHTQTHTHTHTHTQFNGSHARTGRHTSYLGQLLGMGEEWRDGRGRSCERANKQTNDRLSFPAGESAAETHTDAVCVGAFRQWYEGIEDETAARNRTRLGSTRLASGLQN